MLVVEFRVVFVSSDVELVEDILMVILVVDVRLLA